MEVSTPMESTSDLRRKTLLKNTVNMSPLRRSTSANMSLNTSMLNESNDESERSVRRSNVEIQKRLSSIPQETTDMNESYVKEQFLICTHLFTENKINTKNAWKLQIIDLLKPLCEKNDNKDTLQIASTSIDICAKVYGIRVDDVYSNGLKLASSMARIGNKEPQDADDAEEVEENDQEQGKRSSKKKKKKRPTGLKTTVVKGKSILTSLPKLEPVDFSARVNAATGAIDNLFTNVLKEDSTCTTFAFLDKQMTLMTKQDALVKNISENTTEISNLPILQDITNIKLNIPFSDFKIDEWDPDQEQQQLGTDKYLLTQTLVFDNNGIPIPELDGSIPDIFANNGDDGIADDNDDNEIDLEQEQTAPQLRGELDRIVDFRSLASSTRQTEYSYNILVNTHTGKYIDKIWAGPCHWKLKFIKRGSAKFSGTCPDPNPKKSKKKKAPPEQPDFTKRIDPDTAEKLSNKKKCYSVNINKITLPNRYNYTFEETADELLLKPGTCPIRKKKSENLDYEVSPYNYENPNDSLYCPQQADDEEADSGDVDGPLEEYGMETEVVTAEKQNFVGENLVDAPQMVPESYIPYAKRAKQMDMKKLKATIWHNLTNTMIVTINKESQQRSGVVIPTTFSEMYKNLPDLLAEKEKRELTCHLAFVALLHLCNEQNLHLTQSSDYKDFGIKGSN